MTISASQVKELRDLTGAGMMDAKRALVEANGDLEEARLIVRTVHPDTPPRVEYSLTPRGRELCAVLTAFLRRGR